jgi:hypothetical protein
MSETTQMNATFYRQFLPLEGSLDLWDGVRCSHLRSGGNSNTDTLIVKMVAYRVTT